MNNMIIDQDRINEVMEKLLHGDFTLEDRLKSLSEDALSHSEGEDEYSLRNKFITLNYRREGDITGAENMVSLRFNRTKPNIEFVSEHNASLVMPELRCHYIDIDISKKYTARLGQQKLLYGATHDAEQEWIDEGTRYIRYAVEKFNLFEKALQKDHEALRY